MTSNSAHSGSARSGSAQNSASSSLAPKTAAPKVRVALWDNARFVLIVLVVVGHMISTVRTTTDFGFAAYAFLYLFHMPAMIMLSGLFAKPEVNAKAIRSTIQLVVIWVLWEGIWAVIKFVVNDQAPGKGFLVNSSWTLWFLVTLATLRIVFPYIARLRYPLTFSIALALIGGLSPVIGTNFSAARTLAFLPFFVLGWQIKDRNLLGGEWFMKPRALTKIIAAGTLALIAAAFFLPALQKSNWRIDKWLTHRDSYEWLFANAPMGSLVPEGWLATAGLGILIAGVLMLIAGIMTLALLILVPRAETRMTPWGSRTLFVYLLHGVVIWSLRESGVIDAIGGLGNWGILLLIAAAVGLSMLLSMKWVTRVFAPVVEPKFDWLLKRS